MSDQATSNNNTTTDQSTSTTTTTTTTTTSNSNNNSKVIKLVLIRHGESAWNVQNRFTGWTDVPLSEAGIQEAKIAGRDLKEAEYKFDTIFTSVLRRAIKTMWIVQEEMAYEWLPVVRSWRLNERHYGALQGLNKSETAERHGEEQVNVWRRSYDVPPPALTVDDDRYAGLEEKYQSLDKTQLPLTESLKTTVDRVVPYYESEIKPLIQQGKQVLIVAHGNSLRALVKYLDNVSEKDIVSLNIPTAVPLVYELDAETLKPIKHYYVGDQEVINQKIHAVANQGKAK